MRARFCSAVREFFFEPLEIHLEPADLLEEFGGIGLIAGLGGLAGVGEEGLGTVEQSLLPVADEGRMDAVLGGQFAGGAVALDRRPGGPPLERPPITPAW